MFGSSVLFSGSFPDSGTNSSVEIALPVLCDVV